MFQLNLQPTVLQVLGWCLYIVPVLVLLTVQIRGPRHSQRQGNAADQTHETADDVSETVSDVDTSKVS